MRALCAEGTTFLRREEGTLRRGDHVPKEEDSTLRRGVYLAQPGREVYLAQHGREVYTR